MALTITKTKSKTKPVASVDFFVESAVERIAEIDAIIAGAVDKAIVAERKKLVDGLVKLTATAGDLETVTFKGKTHEATFSAKKLVRTIKSMALVKNLLGEKTFMEVAQVSLGDLDKYLSAEQQAKALDASYSGSRSLKITEIA